MSSTPVTISQDQGKAGAAVVYLLYLLSIPSANVLGFVGLILAYAMRGGSSSWVRTHFDRQVGVGWACIWWFLGMAVLGGIGFVLSFVLIGIPIVWLAVAVWFLVQLWLAIVAVLGLLSLLQNRPA